jgi:hypothetical protein
VTVDPSGKFAYVVNVCLNLSFGCVPNGTVSAYTIDSTTGALSPVPGSPFATGADPESVAVDPSGKFAYVTSYSGTVSVYTINSITGDLIPAPGSPFAANLSPVSVAVDPSGKFAYVANYCGNGGCSIGAVSAFNINTTTGALTPVPGSPYATGAVPNTVAVDPSGKFVYVASQCAVGSCSRGIGIVSAYAINSASGALTPVIGSPFFAGVSPVSLAIAGQSAVPFEVIKAKADIDEDRKTSFRVEGFFRLGQGSDGIDPVNESVQLKVGTFSTTIPAGSFKEEGKREFEFEGWINDVELRITIHHVEGRRDEWGDHDAKHDEEKRHEGRDHDADHDKEKLKDTKDYLFTAVGKGHILSGVVNPVAVGLTIGDDEGSTTVKADIDR